MTASLLVYPADPRAQAMWAFDHANAHAVLSAKMNTPSIFNLVRYLLDPIPPTALNGTDNWDMNHQQAHDDAANWYSVQPSLQLTDTDQRDPGAFSWWQFTNLQEHNALSVKALAATGSV